MKLIDLHKRLKEKVKNSEVPMTIFYPFEIFKMKHKNLIEVRFPSDSYVIKKVKNIWKVYYSERGVIYDNKNFKREDEACVFFYNQIFTPDNN